MQIGTALFLLAIGAILRFAVTDRIGDVDLSTVGVILMIVGAVGILVSLMIAGGRDRDVVVRDRRDVY